MKKRYDFLKPLGQGSYGSVFLCEPINHIKDKKVLRKLSSRKNLALKLPHPAPKVKRSSMVLAKLIVETQGNNNGGAAAARNLNISGQGEESKSQLKKESQVI